MGPHPHRLSATSPGRSAIVVKIASAASRRAKGVAAAKPSAVIPAALAPATPNGLSSTTTHRSGRVDIRDAACRKRSGAGFPRLTSSAEKIRPANSVRGCCDKATWLP